MLDWKNQAIEILNAPGFSVTDHDPLHGDIRTFKIRRDERGVLFIDTEPVRGRYFPMREALTGTVRVNRDKVKVEKPPGVKAVLTGVDGLTRVESGNTVRETARIHQLTVTLLDAGPAAHTVEWLENLPSHHAWPNIVERIDGTKKNLSFTDNRIIVADPEGLLGVGRQAAILKVAGHNLYVWGPRPAMEGPTPRSGCIIYEGVPDDLTRKKFRTALSFAFGTYLVETGHTVFDKDWRIVSATARSVYNLGGRASELSIQPLMWLSDRNAEFDIGRPPLTRMVERLFAAYDDLDLPNLSWAYWHARAAPPHIAPAEFGALLDGLQRVHGKKHRGKIPSTILPEAGWDPLFESISAVIDAANIPDPAKSAIKANVQSGTNQAAKRDQLQALGDAIGIVIGDDEHAAWKRRNKSAHGVPIVQSKELETIRDIKLLMVLFHRMLLAITGANDRYLDYATPGDPRTSIRPLKDPVPPVGAK